MGLSTSQRVRVGVGVGVAVGILIIAIVYAHLLRSRKSGAAGPFERMSMRTCHELSYAEVLFLSWRCSS